MHTEATGSAPAEAVLEGLDAEQRAVAESLHGPLCVLAGAGTGKTRAITHRIAYGVRTGTYHPHQVLAVTFTAKAAAEMRSRLNDLGAPGVQARTFHASALRQLQFFWPQTIGGSVPQIIEHKIRLLAEVCQQLGITTDRASLRDYAGEIEWAKVSMLSPEGYAHAEHGREPPADLTLHSFVALFRAYEDLKTERHLMDFDDVLLFTVGMLENDERVAAHVRGQYRHFIVDEYQDVSPLQQRLLDLWLGGRDQLCVVGDAAQTIYSFTGATSQYLLEFRRKYPQAQQVKLIRDYRSTPQIVQAANALLRDRRPSAGWPTPLELVSQREAGPAVDFQDHPDDDAEAQWIASKIQQLQENGTRLAETAVLFRTHSQSAAFEQALSSAGIPYQVRGSERFFSRREVREALAALRTSALSAEPEPLSRAVAALLSSQGYSATPPTTTGAVRERWESLAALVSLAGQLEQQRPEAGLAEFVAELEERSTAQHAPAVEGVTLASLHSAKGLEWDAVFLAGLCEGLMPISFAEDQAGIDEERRLFYVGITRARKHLLLSYATARHGGGRGRRRASRFLNALGHVLPLQKRPARSQIPRSGNSRYQLSPNAAARRASQAQCASCGVTLTGGTQVTRRRCDSCEPRYDETLFQALREWRRQYARSLDTKAFMIFNDATLEAIAENQPLTDEHLLQIPGIGARKLELHGEKVKEALRQNLPSQD